MIQYLFLLLVLVMLGAAVSIIFIRDVLGAVIIVTVVSLVAAILFLFIASPDVAITEASIGAALTTVIFVLAISRTRKKMDKQD